MKLSVMRVLWFFWFFPYGWVHHFLSLYRWCLVSFDWMSINWTQKKSILRKRVDWWLLLLFLLLEYFGIEGVEHGCFVVYIWMTKFCVLIECVLFCWFLFQLSVVDFDCIMLIIVYERGLCLKCLVRTK